MQRKIAKIRHENAILPENGALIMLFLLGFPLLDMEEVQSLEAGLEGSQEELREVSNVSFSNSQNSVDVDEYVCRVWTPLAPQDISIMLRVNLTNRTVSLGLRNYSGDSRFMWQQWVDAAMGYMKGFEQRSNGDWKFGRQIVRADLRKPMLE